MLYLHCVRFFSFRFCYPNCLIWSDIKTAILLLPFFMNIIDKRFLFSGAIVDVKSNGSKWWFFLFGLKWLSHCDRCVWEMHVLIGLWNWFFMVVADGKFDAVLMVFTEANHGSFLWDLCNGNFRILNFNLNFSHFFQAFRPEIILLRDLERIFINFCSRFQ